MQQFSGRVESRIDLARCIAETSCLSVLFGGGGTWFGVF